ncbi:DUF2089 domain-containing protein [Proteinivorax hydrogeniformans]|uniref:DUF2089 domain-containing protein n=1 Tax=Proteinivorax hydrogeniformans TaxID=1826727 RepID=A0AAU8HV10_9FIRM
MKKQAIGKCPICDSHLNVAKLKCNHCDTSIEGDFELCKFCKLGREQKEFVEVFIKSRGNIKEVERELGISYPTVRSRLEGVIESLGYRPEPIPKVDPATAEKRKKVLDALNNGDITAEEAVELLKEQS